mmetsp:Transcript_71669/g.226460  ORF Transcript_71669/g.226460 Transcript_71669/m.226460 type:complete len:553 (+) Transcript_71669:1620-3278(+)
MHTLALLPVSLGCRRRRQQPHQRGALLEEALLQEVGADAAAAGEVHEQEHGRQDHAPVGALGLRRCVGPWVNLHYAALRVYPGLEETQGGEGLKQAGTQLPLEGGAVRGAADATGNVRQGLGEAEEVKKLKLFLLRSQTLQHVRHELREAGTQRQVEQLCVALRGLRQVEGGSASPRHDQDVPVAQEPRHQRQDRLPERLPPPRAGVHGEVPEGAHQMCLGEGHVRWSRWLLAFTLKPPHHACEGLREVLALPEPLPGGGLGAEGEEEAEDGSGLLRLRPASRRGQLPDYWCQRRPAGDCVVVEVPDVLEHHEAVDLDLASQLQHMPGERPHRLHPARVGRDGLILRQVPQSGDQALAGDFVQFGLIAFLALACNLQKTWQHQLRQRLSPLLVHCQVPDRADSMSAGIDKRGVAVKPSSQKAAQGAALLVELQPRLHAVRALEPREQERDVVGTLPHVLDAPEPPRQQREKPIVQERSLLLPLRELQALGQRLQEVAQIVAARVQVGGLSQHGLSQLPLQQTPGPIWHLGQEPQRPRRPEGHERVAVLYEVR